MSSRFLTAPEIVDAVRAACEAAVHAADIERYDVQVRADGMPIARLVLAGHYVEIWVCWLMVRDAIDRFLKRTMDAAVRRLRDAAGGAFVADVWPVNEAVHPEDVRAMLRRTEHLERLVAKLGAIATETDPLEWEPADRALLLKEARDAYVALRERGHRPMLRSWTRSIGGDGGWCRLSCYDGAAPRVVIPVHLNAQGWSVTSPDGKVTESGPEVGMDAVVLAENAAFFLGWWT